MTKLCPRGKAAAKRKFAVYPSAYANAYASKICAGKIKDPSGKKRKDFRGPKRANKGLMLEKEGSLKEEQKKLQSQMEETKKKVKEMKERHKKTFPKKTKPGFERKYPGPARPGNPVVFYEVKKGAIMNKPKKAALGAMMIGKKMLEEKMPAGGAALKMKKKLLGMNKGGGADMSKEPSSKIKVAERAYALALSKKNKDRMTKKDIETATSIINKKAKPFNKGGLKAELNNPAKGYTAGGMADYYKDLM